MTTFRPFRCGECGSVVREEAAGGRTTEYLPGVRLPVPDTFAIPTCSGCGEQYMTVEEAERLGAAQEPLFVEWQRRRVAEAH